MEIKLYLNESEKCVQHQGKVVVCLMTRRRQQLFCFKEVRTVFLEELGWCFAGLWLIKLINLMTLVTGEQGGSKKGEGMHNRFFQLCK